MPRSVAFTACAWIACTASVSTGNHISITQVGAPIWQTADHQLFSATADTAANFNAVFASLVPNDLPTHTPHGPPYDTELSDNAALNGYADNQTVYLPDDIDAAPRGVYYASMIVPAPGVTGRSRDFVSGPVIPASVFPISRDIDLWLEGVLVDSLASCCDIAVGNIPPNTSHTPVVTALFQPWEFDPTATFGDYQIRESLRDSQGNGYDITVDFSVVPEPATISGLLMMLVLLATAQRRNTLR